MKVIRIRNGEIAEVVGVNQNRKKLVFRINDKFAGTNPLGDSFRVQDWRNFDSASPTTRATIKALTGVIADLDRDIERLRIRQREHMSKLRTHVQAIRPIDAEALPVVKLLTRDETKKAIGSIFDRVNWEAPDAFHISQVAEVPRETSDQTEA